MAVLQMSKIQICGIRRDRKKLLEFLQRRGCVEVHTSDVCEVFSGTDVQAAKALLKKNAQDAAKADTILAHYNTEKTSPFESLKGRQAVGVSVGDEFYGKSAQILEQAHRVIALERSAEEAKAALLKLDEQEEALTPWLELPIPQSMKSTKHTSIFVGSLAGNYTADDIEEKLVRAGTGDAPIHVQVVYASKEQTCFYLIVRNKDNKAAEESLRLLGFVYPASPIHRIPADEKKAIGEKRQTLLSALEKAEQEIRDLLPAREDIRFLEDHMTMREEKYGVIEKLAVSRHTFVLNGYVASRDLPSLQSELERRFNCVIEAQGTEDDANSPVQLSNHPFTQPAEMVLESYSMPSPAEIDPTPVMSIFYYIMFGLMFSDAGYGLILVLACGALLLSFKNMEAGMKRFFSMFLWCGISTVFWGVVFSSYFGDVVNVVSKNFLGREVGIPPLWFAPLESPMKLLIFCLGIGIIHLLTAYIMKALNLVKSKQYIDVLYDVAFPIIILLCLVYILMGSAMFYDMAGFQITVSAQASNVALGIAGVSMIGVILTGGRESRQWFKRFLKGLYALYNVLAGWLSDILSYSRLLALGLATGVIASVINSLGAMAGKGIVGLIIFAVVFVFGHALNFGINVLGAYVHSNRLEFVEFFGKFYEGGGRKFLPYAINTKHYIIKEEI